MNIKNKKRTTSITLKDVERDRTVEFKEQRPTPQ
jgi:hypothetical protein